MDKSLTGNEIVRATNGEAKIRIYSDVYKMRSIDELFEGHDAIALLYQIKSVNYGHWVALIRRDNTIFYADSYGDLPEEPLDYVSQEIKRKCHENHHYLARLILEGGYECDFNDVPLQQLSEGINTCGRWVVSRIIFSSLSNENWAKLFSQYDDPDALVVAFTDLVLG